jgi:hypothetical protein
MEKLWAIWGADHDYDSGDSWIAGIYANEDDAIIDCEVLNKVVAQFKRNPPGTSTEHTLRDQEFSRIMTRIDDAGGGDISCLVYCVSPLVDNNVRTSAIGPETEFELRMAQETIYEEIKSQLTEHRKKMLLEFFKDIPYRGIVDENHRIVPELQDALDFLLMTRLIAHSYSSYPYDKPPFEITSLGKAVAKELK